VQDPEKYLKDFDIRLTCPVRPRQVAAINPQLRAFVNHEVFYFSDYAARAKFLKQPERYCGRITDPVSRVRFVPTRSSPRWIWNSRPYYFASDSSRLAFQATPDTFAVRRGM
jgi:YHS domain-containing protein